MYFLKTIITKLEGHIKGETHEETKLLMSTSIQEQNLSIIG